MQPDFIPLTNFMSRIPSVNPGFGTGVYENGNWWIKFQLDIDHPLAWKVVQELGHIVNYISLKERLPTWFYPVSPPVYMNGGPKDFLSWVIESTEAGFTPALLAEWLEGRMPRPVDDITQWKNEDDK